MSDPLFTAWAQQPVAPLAIDPALLEDRARRLEARVWRRDAIEYAACVAAIAAFGWIGWTNPDTLVRIACGLIALGTLIVARGLWVRRPRIAAGALGAQSMAYYRAALVQQRDALASVWRWYLLPVVPGLALFLFGIARGAAGEIGAVPALVGIAPSVLIVTGVFAGIHWLNRRAARAIGREIETLDAELSSDHVIDEGDDR